MIKNIITIILILITTIGYSQSNIKKTYYSDKNAKKEAKNGKGKYVMIEQTVNDSIIQKKFIKNKTNTPIWIKEFLNGKPYGKWISYTETGQVDYEFDYQFILKYGVNIPSGFLKVDFKNKRTETTIDGKFEMPYLDNPTNGFQRFIVHNMRYPSEAFTNRIQGTTHAQLTIDKNGKISNISIIKGVVESLDRETFRLIHSMPNWIPAKLNGKNIDVYMIIPLNYRLK